MKHFQAFTEKYNKIENTLITKCYVGEPLFETQPDATFIEFRALWDTGATFTSISDKVAASLGLIPVSKITINHALGQGVVNEYDVGIVLPNNAVIPYISVGEGKFDDCDVLIGMDIISLGDFSISNLNNRTTFSFRMPPFQEIDFVNDQVN